MVCPRCGAEMNPEQRYCMKCGALNYDHPDNKQMKTLMSEKEFEKSNKDYQKNATKEVDKVEFAGQTYETRTRKKNAYVDTRAALGLLLVMTAIFALFLYFFFYFTYVMIFASCVYYAFFSFLFLSLSCAYMKGGYSGFTPMVPIYNLYAYCDIATGHGWLFFLLLIPIVNIFFLIYLNYQFGKSFGRSGWMMVFLPFIMIPYIAFSDTAVYQGNGVRFSSFVEKGKRRNPTFSAFIYAVFSFVVCIIILIPISNVVKYRIFPMDMENVLQTVHVDVDEGYYRCENADINVNAGTYYIPFTDITDLLNYQLLPTKSPFNGELLKGYVEVIFTVDSSGRRNYSYSLTVSDGELGLVDFTEGSHRTVKKVEDVSIPENAIVCKKTEIS